MDLEWMDLVTLARPSAEATFNHFEMDPSILVCMESSTEANREQLYSATHISVDFERVYFFCKWRVQHNKDTTVAVSHPAGDRTHFQSKERIFCRTPDAKPKDS
ncbi:unnamed protein product [Gadus morhua 'NCC']